MDRPTRARLKRLAADLAFDAALALLFLLALAACGLFNFPYN